MAFNIGKPYHGPEAVQDGKLRGQTGRSDYFFFLCPRCDADQALRILEYEFREPSPPTERVETKKPTQYFNLAFRLYCPNCLFEDFIKIDNNHKTGPLSPE